ncbi:uracil phosphoribosyltransferase-like protein [Sarcoptes scabiei]|uniref:Uracil phosphoribosyltransferase-like protein n=1 Tax=Sarcoptes scabiei TaxID=52283 RepID=A0A132ABG2_SARSC|nr:uracil phosphoribosyltransferase-like protein [Sarcoptes scabiei]
MNRFKEEQGFAWLAKYIWNEVAEHNRRIALSGIEEEKIFHEEDVEDELGSDDYVENEQDLARVVELDKLIKSLDGVQHATIQANLYVNVINTVKNVRVLNANDNIVMMHTIIRNKLTPRDDFIFNTDRLVRLIVYI